MRKLIKIAIYVLPLIYAGCASLQSVREVTRTPSSISVVELDVPPGTRIIFYKEYDNTVIKQCQDYTFVKYKKDCIKKEGTRVAKVPHHVLYNSLISNLQMPDIKPLEHPKDELKPYKSKLEATKEDLEEKIETLVMFTEAFPTTKIDMRYIGDFREKLADFEGDLSISKEISTATIELNKKIRLMAIEIVQSGRTFAYISSSESLSFLYNILNAHLSTLSLQPKFTTIPSGKFYMDPKLVGKDRTDITISNDYKIMKGEVTQEQWFNMMGYNPSYFSKQKYCPNSHSTINGVEMCNLLPVENVSWNEVQSFITKLNLSVGLKDNCDPESLHSGCYRLPTEAEWQYAAGRVNAKKPDEIKGSTLNKYAWVHANSNQQLHPVATRRGNLRNVYNLYGNVSEWVADIYMEKLPRGTDPLNGRVKGVFSWVKSQYNKIISITKPNTIAKRSIRGGNWSSGAHQPVSLQDLYTKRFAAEADHKSPHIGFRLVKSKLP